MVYALISRLPAGANGCATGVPESEWQFFSAGKLPSGQIHALLNFELKHRATCSVLARNTILDLAHYPFMLQKTLLYQYVQL